MNKSLILIGMPGAGKSTVGVLLAKRLARPFIDLDLCIQAGERRTLRQIIDEVGLEEFCRLESRYTVAQELSGHVVATGGSIVYSPDAMQFLGNAGTLIYLKLSLEVLRGRLDDLAARGVVMQPGMTFDELYVKRCPLYQRWADVAIDCDGLDHTGVVNAIVSALAAR